MSSSSSTAGVVRPVSLKRLIWLLSLPSLWFAAALPSYGLPSFARQTGEACSSCHVGSIGPQLTAEGMDFKLNGFTRSNGVAGHLPLSAMLVGSWTATKKDQSGDAGPHQGPNDNAVLQEASVFLAGRLTEHSGAFVQGTYTGIERKWEMDNADVRYVRPVQMGDKDALIGVTFNNNPTVTDPFNNLPAWRFPFMSSELTPEPGASPILDGGLEQQVGGISVYTLWNDAIYAELGGYRTFSRSFLEGINVISRDDPLDKIDGVAPYWRLAYMQQLPTYNWQVGVFGFDPKLKLDGNGGGRDKYNDIGIDASYQFLGTGEHLFTVNGAYIHEKRRLDGSVAAGDASKANTHVDRFDLSGSYYFDNTWGLTAKLFDIRGSSDKVLYAPEPDAGSRVGKPDTNGYMLQADWTPFGKVTSWNAPWANLRLALQYTAYNKFNGASHNYDGSGRDASDNNTWFAFVWTAF